MSLRHVADSLDFIGSSAIVAVTAARQTRSVPTSEQVPLPSNRVSQNHEAETVSQVSIETHKLCWLFKETSAKVSYYEKLVREHKEPWAALGFARFVFWSGLLDMFDQVPGDQINAPLLRYRIKELEANAVAEAGTKAHREAVPELDALHRKLDLIAGQLSKLSQR